MRRFLVFIRILLTSTVSNNNMLTIPKINPVTNVALLIDASGSMGGREAGVIKQLNAVIDGLKEGAIKNDQKVMVSLFTFNTNIKQLLAFTDIQKFPKFTTKDYSADGGTSMNAAIAKAIDTFPGRLQEGDANIVTVITDGEEVTGIPSFGTINDRMRQLISTDQWTFSFLVPTGLKRALLRNLPAIADGNVTEWELSTKGMEGATKALSTGYASYLNLRSVGGTSSKGFFTAQVDANAAKQAKKKLDDVQGDFKQMTVRTQDPKMLQDFIESRGLVFQKGRSFYQLTKSETVQSHKNVLLREIKTGAIYGGRDARDILGLPDLDAKVKPADFSDWDIFVQSTSNNRKLVVGTNLLYLK